MKKFTPIFFLCLFLISFISLSINVKAEDDISLETYAKTEIDSKSYLSDSSNLTQTIDNYQNTTVHNGTINFMDIPYGNAKPYLERDLVGEAYNNYTIKNDENNVRYLHMIDNNKIDSYGISFRQYNYFPSNNNFNYSMLFKTHMNTTNTEIFVYDIANSSISVGLYILFYLNNLIKLSFNGTETIWYSYNPNELILFEFDKSGLNFHSTIKQNNIIIVELNVIGVNDLFFPNNIVYIQFFDSDYSINPNKNLSIYAIDSNQFLKVNSDISDWSPSDYTDSYYTNTRILQTYNINAKSYNTFDYMGTIADKVNYQYNSANCSVAYQMVPTQHKILGSTKYIMERYSVNALNISFNQPYSEFNITDTLTISNYADFIKYIVVENPNKNFTVEFSNDTDYIKLMFYENGTVRCRSKLDDAYINNFVVAHNTTSIPALREYALGVGISDYFYPNVLSYEIRNNTYNDIYRTSSAYWNSSIYASFKFRIRNYNDDGGTIGNIIIKGITTTVIDITGLGVTSNLKMLPNFHNNYTEYVQTYTHYFNYPTVSGYKTYKHYIAYINCTLDINSINEYYVWITLATQNDTNYMSTDGEASHLYGYNIFYYNTVDNYTMNITDSFDVYGSNIQLALDYSITYVILWYYYQYALEDSLFQTIFELLVPIGMLVMFPYVFGRTFGKKGSVIGLIMGIIILGVSELVSFTLSLILVLMGLAVGVIVWKSKEKTEGNMGGIYFD